MRSQRSCSICARSVLTADCVWEGAGKGSSGGAAPGADEGPAAAGAEVEAGGGNDIGAPDPRGGGMDVEGKRGYE